MQQSFGASVSWWFLGRGHCRVIPHGSDAGVRAGAGIAPREHGLHFGENGERDLLGSVGTQIQPDGACRRSRMSA